MNIWKKFFALILVVMLVSAVLGGCSNANGGDTGADTNGTTTAPTQSQIVIPTFTSKPKDDGKVTYTVTVLDQNSSPVAGVSVQFCDEENCKLPVNTDANGVVTGTYAPSAYHITLVELPAGYTSEETVFYFGDATELTIVVTAE